MIYYRIAGVEFDDGDYSMLNSNLVLFFQTYRNSIGDIAPPTYPRWVTAFESGDSEEYYKGLVMIAIIWFVWVAHQFVILILLLNFLIAIVSQSYENVMQQTDYFIYN